MKISMNELFSGIGAQKSAMDRLCVDCTVVGISDIDKYANQSYYAVHGQTRQYGDISKIEKLDYADLWTYSFPCQDLSVAGKQAGITENSRSGLLFQVERLLERAVHDGTQPKYLLLENVKNLICKKFKADFDRWLNKLDELGYKNYWKVLNAKNYGVPQNRERVFVVSIRKDIQQTYEFPKEIPLTKRLKDVLETNVDEKYYLSEDKVARFIKSTKLSKYPFGQEYKVLGSTSETPEKNTTNSRQWVMDANTVSPTLDATQYKSPKQFAVREATKQGYSLAEDGDSINLEQPNSETRRGRVGHQMANILTCSCNQGVVGPVCCASRGRNPENTSDRTTGSLTEQRLEFNKNGTTNTITTVAKDNYIAQVKQVGNIVNTGNWENPQRGRIYDSNGCSPALNTMQGGGLEPKIIDEIYQNRPPREYGNYCPTLMDGHAGDLEVKESLAIRKLTPKECWRLMGFTDEEFEKAKASGVSNSQLYKQAGNSIVVDVLVAIFMNLFSEVNNG